MTTEKKVSHTPAPWSLLVEGDEDSCIVRTVMGTGNRPRNLSEVALITTGSYSDEVEDANAKLIAASPTMYAYIQKQAIEGDKEAQKIIKSCE
jgi:hypothetical protein